ncbi:unnamed protein product [Miscanthus lutarioriparius]|uniref:Legume lectin domain-containing protein n=1 Tax=Miscanthus lutarioriparius TaxID=422564 RepID=A0A811QL37_9POAL|nr:unnamed protein product [Miscanthus lutarioriparius]
MASPFYTGIRRRFALLVSATLILFGTCSCLQFSYPSFGTANEADFSFSAGAGIADGALQITPSTGDLSHRSGRVCYARETLKLWNRKRTALTSFRTEFVLNILPRNGTGEGMAFILTNNPELPRNSSGQWLGLVNSQTDGSPANRIVAVEFDTRKSGEHDHDDNHVGLDVNSVESASAYPLSNLSIVLSSGADVWVTIEYDGAALSIVAVQTYSFMYSWAGDLSQYLTDGITVGFAASTGDFTELNQIKSWNFTTLGDDADGRWRHRKKMRLLLAYLIPFAIAGSFLAFCAWRRLTRPRRLAYRNLEKMIDAQGPVRFKFRELRNATANFSSDRKLGRGGFGTVPVAARSYRDGDDEASFGRGRQPPMHIVDWAWRLYGEGRAEDAADAALGGEFDPAEVDRAVRLALACCHPNPRERPSMRTSVQVLVGGAGAPEPPLLKPAFVWPPFGERQEIELAHVGVLFTGGGGHSSFCSLSSTSFTGR